MKQQQRRKVVPNAYVAHQVSSLCVDIQVSACYQTPFGDARDPRNSVSSLRLRNGVSPVLALPNGVWVTSGTSGTQAEWRKLRCVFRPIGTNDGSRGLQPTVNAAGWPCRVAPLEGCANVAPRRCRAPLHPWAEAHGYARSVPPGRGAPPREALTSRPKPRHFPHAHARPQPGSFRP